MTNVSQISSLLAATSSTASKKNTDDGFASIIAQLSTSAKVEAKGNATKETSKISIAANLNAAQAVSTNGVPNFTRGVQVYDEKGKAHDVNIEFTKTGQNQWSMKVSAADKSELAKSYKTAEIASGTVSFNADGSLKSVSQSLKDMDVKWVGQNSQSIKLDLGKTGGFAGLTQLNSDYKVSSITQNGSAQIPKLNIPATLSETTSKVDVAIEYPADKTNMIMPNNFSRSFNIYDSKGNAHEASVNLQKISDGTYSVNISQQDPNEVKGFKQGQLAYALASGTISFNADGSVKSVSPELQNFNVKWKNGGEANNVKLNFATTTAPAKGNSGILTGTPIGADGNSIPTYPTMSLTANGAPKGTLETVVSGAGGKYTATYTNGLSKDFYAKTSSSNMSLASILNEYDSNNSISNSLKSLLANKAYAS